MLVLFVAATLVVAGFALAWTTQSMNVDGFGPGCAAEFSC